MPPPGKCGHAAHPRVGGENDHHLYAAPVCPGSSPRGRGKHRAGRRAGRQRRLIPAWAGKTCLSRAAAALTAAHPRVGGENPLAPGIAFAIWGSSPRGRGKRSKRIPQRMRGRLIPAWAGKTSCLMRPSLTARAHPRVGGENRCFVGVDQGRAGSSPRGRGKRRRRDQEFQPSRLIPAWAGKTRVAHLERRGVGAHPRVGGENLATTPTPPPLIGSSPRGRGKPLAPREESDTSRLIPAWAGKTLPDLRFYRADRSDLGNPWACRLFWKLLIFGRLRN